MSDELKRPTADEFCPRCGSRNITASDQIPSMSCADCGDRWAGVYRRRVTVPAEALAVLAQAASLRWAEGETVSVPELPGVEDRDVRAAMREVNACLYGPAANPDAPVAVRVSPEVLRGVEIDRTHPLPHRRDEAGVERPDPTRVTGGPLV